MSSRLFVSIGEGTVEEEKWEILKAVYQSHRQHLPEGMLQSYLLQNHEEPTIWRMVSFWLDELSYENARGDMESFLCEDLFAYADCIPQVKVLHAEEITKLILDNLWEL